jgi:phytoene/squalene synthetase
MMFLVDDAREHVEDKLDVARRKLDDVRSYAEVLEDHVKILERALGAILALEHILEDIENSEDVVKNTAVIAEVSR